MGSHYSKTRDKDTGVASLEPNLGNPFSSRLNFTTNNVLVASGIQLKGSDNCFSGCGLGQEGVRKDFSLGDYSNYLLTENSGYSSFQNLKQLIDTFGQNNINITELNLQVSGKWNGHDCGQSITLYIESGGISNVFLNYSTGGLGGGGETLTSTKNIFNGKINSIPALKVYYNRTGSTGCYTRLAGWTDISVYASMKGYVDVQSYCETTSSNPSQSNFFKSICNDFCINPYNSNCLQAVQNNCFKRLDPDVALSEGIFTNETCKNWILENVKEGGSTQIDDKISELCFGNEINPSNYRNNLDTQNICACHFDPQIYQNYYQSLVQKIPNLQFAGLGSSKCIFPGCPISPYKSIDILGENRCPTVQCIQGVSLDIQGKVGGNVSVALEAECLQFTSDKSCTMDVECPQGFKCSQQFCRKICTADAGCPTGYKCNLTNQVCEKIQVTPAPSPAPDTNPNNTGLVIGIVVGVVILIIIVILFVIVSSQKSKVAPIS
jgi:hypothetical protein